MSAGYVNFAFLMTLSLQELWHNLSVSEVKDMSAPEGCLENPNSEKWIANSEKYE